MKQAMAVIDAYENKISRTLLDIREETRRVKIFGVHDVERLEERVPTYSFTIEGWHPQEVAKRLAQDEIYVRDGNYYAISVTEHLGLEESGDMVRVGLVHYNTLEEVRLFGDKLGKIVES